jgi:hypothetical protein
MTHNACKAELLTAQRRVSGAMSNLLLLSAILLVILVDDKYILSNLI